MIIVGFQRDRSLKSRLIRWITMGEWSHAWIEYNDKLWGGDWIAEATAAGVDVVPLERAPKKGELVLYVVKSWDVDPGFKVAKDFIGTEYDWLSVIWNSVLMVLFKITGWMWIWNKVRRDSSKATCSEFVTIIIKGSRMPGSEKLDPELTTPGKLQKFCESSSYFFPVIRRGGS